jgi:hypothetical protein
VSSGDKSVEIPSSDAAAPDIRTVEADAADQPGKTPNQVQAPADSTAARTMAVESDSPRADAAKSSEKSSEQTEPGATAASDSRAVADEKKDQTSPPDSEKATVAKPDSTVAAAPKRTGQISVFVSRKDSKLYVRQNFAPLFDVPVTIAPSDRPLGTHVFTAQVDPNDANRLHWSVVSLPAAARNAERRDEDERASRRHKMAGGAEMKPLPVPDSPTEALDRLSIPADAMARITDALSTGGSIIVSDQGIAAGETGEGTDFIVSLR